MASLYSTKEIINGLDAVKKECLQLKAFEFFDTNFVTGYAKLEDFKASQSQYIHKGIRKIVDMFPNRIYEIIKQ